MKYHFQQNSRWRPAGGFALRVLSCLSIKAQPDRMVTTESHAQSCMNLTIRVPGTSQSFISCHLDYCNSLFSGITDGLLGRLQSVQNAAARLVTGTRRCDHITPVLRQLHWLPVRRVDFKLALLVYRALHDATVAYLVDDCQLVSHTGRRRLRSADIDACCVPRTNTRFGDRSFAAAGPRLWNSLPARIRQPDNDTGDFVGS